MIELVRTLRIRRPQEEVFDHLANLQNVVDYIGPITSIDQVSTPELRAGTRVTVEVHFLGLGFRQRAECIDHRRPETFAARSVGGRFYFEAGFTLHPRGETTILEGWGRAQAPGLFSIGEQILGFLIARQIDSDLRRVRKRLEGGG